jgi:4-diphosphocytidyl-2-C-methyl-D-erythritol kinase
MREIRVFAPAKLNLYLDVLDRRPDGFHNIETLFEKIDLKDEIIIKEKGKGINVKASLADCGQGRKNIVYKAVTELCKEARARLNLEIYIKKNIPISAGLGGGSSDAAAALRAINKLFVLGINKARLFSIARDVGKDTPFFMTDRAFCVGKGAGELLRPLDIKHLLFHIVVKPDISLSTRMMYKRIDRYNCLARRHSLQDAISALKKNDISLLEKSYYNAFENTLARDSIYINRVKLMLFNAGAGHSLLSGSGASVFCTFKNRKEAETVFNRLPRRKGMNHFLVSTNKGDIWR